MVVSKLLIPASSPVLCLKLRISAVVIWGLVIVAKDCLAFCYGGGGGNINSYYEPLLQDTL